MGGTLIAKEMRAHLLSFRFLASFVILFVLIAVTAVVLTGDYVRSSTNIPRARRRSTATSGTTPTSTGSAASSSRPSRPFPSWRSSGASRPTSTWRPSTTTRCRSCSRSST